MLPFPLLYSLGSAAIAPLLFGYHMAELNAPESAIRCPSSTTLASGLTSLPPCIPMSTSDYGLVTSIFAFGGLVGALFGGTMSNKFGRRGSLLLCSLIFALGGLIMAFARNRGWMLVGRVLSGVASGASVVVTPLYVHELAPPKQKGVFGALTQISVNLGILLTQILGLFLSKEVLWRFILVAGAILGALQGVLLLTAQESPKWLYAMGREQEAEESLQAIRGGNVTMEETRGLLHSHHRGHDEEEPLIRTEEEGHASHTVKQKGANAKVSLWEFITVEQYRKSLIAVIGIMLVQQLTGINAIVMYGVSVLRELIPERGAALINVFISVINLLFTFLASRFFDSAGRKPFLLASLTGLGFNSLVLGIGIIYHIPFLSAAATVLFVSSFSIGLGPIPWMVAAEIVTFDASGAAQSISLSANWIGTFIVSYGFPVLAATGIGKGGMFLIFAAIATIGAVFIDRFIPETKGVDPGQAWREFEQGIQTKGIFPCIGKLRDCIERDERERED